MDALIRAVVLAGLTFVGAAQAVTNEVSWLKPSFYGKYDFSTAYHSRGRICEDRPVFLQLTRIGTDIGPYGKVGLWNWDVSALNGRRQNLYRRVWHEMDYGVFYRYDWQINDEWSLTSDVMKDWITLPGARGDRRGHSDATIQEYRFYQMLKNPYITPWYLVRRGLHPNDWLYFRVGLQKSFNLTDTLTLTPITFVELGSENHFEYRYGSNPHGGRYHSGAQAMMAQLELAWKVADWISLTATLSQFGILSGDARDGIVENGAIGTRHRDFTLFAVGAVVKF